MNSDGEEEERDEPEPGPGATRRAGRAGGALSSTRGGHDWREPGRCDELSPAGLLTSTPTVGVPALGDELRGRLQLVQRREHGAGRVGQLGGEVRRDVPR